MQEIPRAKQPGYQSFVDAEWNYSGNQPNIEGTELILADVHRFVNTPESFKYTPYTNDPYNVNRPYVIKIKGIDKMILGSLDTFKWTSLVVTGTFIFMGESQLAILSGIGSLMVFSVARTLSKK